VTQLPAKDQLVLTNGTSSREQY